jgi:hypothetical protein
LVFNPEKDKTIREVVVDADRDKQKLEVKLVSYDEGPEKIQISRYDAPGDAPRKYLKLGRMSVSEAEKVRDAITELIEGPK